MKKKIAILGSTGSIGKTLINLIKKDKKNFEITLLTANKNYKELIKQAKYFKVRNLIISNKDSFNKAQRKLKNQKFNIYQNYNFINKIFKKKNDFIMSSITGLEGLEPTLNSIKFTKNILIANKEAIICGWNLIQKEMLKHKTNFIPIDSEHFSIWSLLKKNEKSQIDKIYITASGGPFLRLPKKKFDKISVKSALQHPNWKMGKKITIDSSTMMNKVFEIIEAKKIFNLNFNQLDITIHSESYVHALIKFSDGMIKIIAHDTTMKIPIFNSIYLNKKKFIKSNEISFDKLNRLNFKKIDLKKFPSVKLLKNLPNKNSLYETALVSANDAFVEHFINKKIKYNDIIYKLTKIMNSKEIKKLKKIVPTRISQVITVNKYVRKQINLKYVQQK